MQLYSFRHDLSESYALHPGSSLLENNAHLAYVLNRGRINSGGGWKAFHRTRSAISDVTFVERK